MRKGSVTVFFTLLFPIVLALVFTLLETARLGGVRLKARNAGNAAVSSVMAGYNRELLDSFGLLFYDGSFNGGTVSLEDMEKEFRDYFERNGESGVLAHGGTLFPVKCESVEISDLVTATDYNGSVFMRSAIDYFKYDAIGDLVEKIKSWVNSVKEADKAKSDSDAGKLQWDREEFGIETTGEGPMPRAEAADSGEASEPFDAERFEKEAQDSVIGQADKTKAKGWLSLVLPGDGTVSSVSMDMTDAPSATAVDDRETDGGSVFSDITNVVLFNEYLMDHFGYFSAPNSKGGMQYEIEYLLYGKEKDSENLEKVLNRIMWIREGMNLIYIATSNLANEAEDMATGLFGWTENPIIIALAAVAIVGAWAYGEALLDVRGLLAGKRVAFIKNKDTWMTSLDNLGEFFKAGNLQAKESKTGLDYKDYLRILLYLTSTSDSAYRAMDIIQLRLREKVPNFLMSSQVYAVEFKATVNARALFSSLPNMKNMLNTARGYRFEDYFSEVY